MSRKALTRIPSPPTTHPPNPTSARWGPPLSDASVGLPDGRNVPGVECVQRIVGVAVDGDYS